MGAKLWGGGGFAPRAQLWNSEQTPQTPWLLSHTVAKQKWHAQKSPSYCPGIVFSIERSEWSKSEKLSVSRTKSIKY